MSLTGQSDLEEYNFSRSVPELDFNIHYNTLDIQEELRSPYSNIIDFDEAQREWRLNKKQISKGFFRYKCSYFSQRRQRYCKKKLYNPVIKTTLNTGYATTGIGEYCSYHYVALNKT